jgi:hypothetical protein
MDIHAAWQRIIGISQPKPAQPTMNDLDVALAAKAWLDGYALHAPSVQRAIGAFACRYYPDRETGYSFNDHEGRSSSKYLIGIY